MVGKITLVAAFAVGCLLGGSTATAVAGTRSSAVAQSSSQDRAGCPSPQALRSLLAEASERLAQARFQDAGGILTPLAARNCDARISLLLAASFEGQGDISAARAELERAHHRWPANDSIAASLARSYLAAGDNDKAAQALAHFRATPDTPEQEMRMASVVYLAAHQLQSAEQVARLAYRTYPSLKTLLLLSNTLQMEGRYPDVNRLLGTQRAAYGDSGEFLVTLAESESDAKIYATARDDLQRAIVLEPGRYQAHYLLGNVLAALNQTDQAIAEYRKAIELAPDQPRTWFQLAMVFRAKQDKAGEQNALQRALAIDNHYAPAQCEVGNMLLQDHHAADAIGHLTIAIQSNPRSEKAYFLLARAYAQMGEHERSEQTVRRLIAVRKENRPQQGRISEP